MLYVTFGTITVHIQPFGPSLQHFQERDSIRYWGARLLPRDVYDSTLGKFGLIRCLSSAYQLSNILSSGIVLFGCGETLLCFMAIFGTGYAAVQLVVYSQTTRHWLGVLL